MSAKDRFHEAAKTALEKDGWVIEEFFTTPFIQSVIKRSQINLLTFELERSYNYLVLKKL